MKGNNLYVVIDTDDVGEKVGQAVLNDDVEGLESISKNINQGANLFSEWATSVGGKVISAANDECTLSIPEEAVADLENIRQQYASETGFNASIGVGSKLSEAAKALVHAKMTGKDQVVRYSEEVEQALSGARADDVVEQGQDDSDDVSIDQHDDQLDGFSKDREEQDSEENGETDDFEQISGEGSDQDEDMDGDTSSLDEDGDGIPEDKEDYDLDGRPDTQEPHGEIDPISDDLDQDGDIEHEEADAAKSPEDSKEYNDKLDYEDEYLQDEDGEMQNTIQGQMENGSDSEEPTGDGEMPQEDSQQSMSPEMDQQDPMAEGGDQGDSFDPNMEGVSEEELKQEIYANLQSFKQNKEHLEQIKQDNPELYSSMIAMLQSMIEMAKQMGYQQSDPQEGQGQAPAQGMPKQMTSQPDMQKEALEAPMGEEEEDESPVPGGEKKLPFQKSENYDKLSQAYRLIKAYKERIDLVKSAGVHDEAGKGTSFRGAHVRNVKDKKAIGDLKSAHKSKKEAIEFSNRMRKENKKIKPNLPKSEIIRAIPKKK